MTSDPEKKNSFLCLLLLLFLFLLLSHTCLLKHFNIPTKEAYNNNNNNILYEMLKSPYKVKQHRR